MPNSVSAQFLLPKPPWPLAEPAVSQPSCLPLSKMLVMWASAIHVMQNKMWPVKSSHLFPLVQLIPILIHWFCQNHHHLLYRLATIAPLLDLVAWANLFIPRSSGTPIRSPCPQCTENCCSFGNVLRQLSWYQSLALIYLTSSSKCDQLQSARVAVAPGFVSEQVHITVFLFVAW